MPFIFFLGPKIACHFFGSNACHLYTHVIRGPFHIATLFLILRAGKHIFHSILTQYKHFLINECKFIDQKKRNANFLLLFRKWHYVLTKKKRKENGIMKYIIVLNNIDKSILSFPFFSFFCPGSSVSSIFIYLYTHTFSSPYYKQHSTQT